MESTKIGMGDIDRREFLRDGQPVKLSSASFAVFWFFPRLKSSPHFVKTPGGGPARWLSRFTKPPEGVVMKKVCAPLLAVVLVLCVSFIALADTIRLKDGSVVKGQVVGFKDQQFVVLVGNGERGRRSRLTLYMEDVESIEFDASSGIGNSTTGPTNSSEENVPVSQTEPVRQTDQTRAPTQTDNYPRNTSASPSRTIPQSSQPSSSPTFFTVNTRVPGDNAANGWKNTGLVIRKGQRIRVNATGRVGLGNGRFATPGGLPTLPDGDKLMRNEATGALIAVIGDDNDDFILLGSRREFTALRDGVLFLGVNEGNLNDNTGAYDVVVEAEAMGGR
jgi:hypothetical protein